MPQKTEVQQLSCPIADHYRTSAQTQAGAAARLIEHLIDVHVEDCPDVVAEKVKLVTGQFR